MSGRGRAVIAALLVGGAIVVAAALLADPRGAVDWRAARVVVFESDDWGLCGFFPAAGGLPDSARQIVGPGGFPPAYWSSTLEDSATVADLAATLAGHRGRDGLPPVLQANMIVSALTPPEDPGQAGRRQAWRQTDLPDLPALYARRGLWRAVADAIAMGVWRPELHGAFHYDPDRRVAAAASSPAALAIAQRGTPLFPGSARAWELGRWRPTSELASELDHSLRVFGALFGRQPRSIAAPDYVWDGRCEALWQSRGLRIIQAKREQRGQFSSAGPLLERILKAAGRVWDRRAHPGRTYLERNCRFEPAQSGDGRTVARCLAAITAAWRRGEPAVVETHRVNFVSLARGAGAAGRRELAALLDSLSALPGGPPLYLTDVELAQILRGGVGQVRRGDSWVARNLTRSARLIAISDDDTPDIGRLAGAAAGPDGSRCRLVLVPAGATISLPDPHGSVRP